MIDESILKEIIISQKKIFLNKKDLFGRAILKDFYKKYGRLKEIIVITGIRRVGKSSLMKLIWEEFKIKNRLTNEQFFYVNFEDERLISFDKNDFQKLIQIYYELNSPAKNKKIFLFLDEIQNVKYWEKWLNRLHEENKFKIFITGSNSTLLSSELATALTGRNVSITLFPLSFYEFFVYFKNNDLTKQSFYDLEQKVKIKKEFQKYLKLGGMPECVKTESPELIQEYFKNILLRDIVNRRNIKHKQGLNELAHILLSNAGQIYSLRNLSKSIEIGNINTIKNYIQYLEESFLFSKLPFFSFSYKAQIYNPHKIYVADISFFNNIAFKFSENKGTIYETIVYLALKTDKNNEIFYYKTKKNFEVDFLIKKGNKIDSLIQVSSNMLNAKTIEREERALVSAMDELKVSKGIIISESLEKEKKLLNKKIVYIPLWRWLLSG